MPIRSLWLPASPAGHRSNISPAKRLCIRLNCSIHYSKFSAAQIVREPDWCYSDRNLRVDEQVTNKRQPAAVGGPRGDVDSPLAAEEFGNNLDGTALER